MSNRGKAHEATFSKELAVRHKRLEPSH